MVNEYYLGIDFGTSNLAVALLPKGESSIFSTSKATVLPLGKNGSTTIPSYLFFPQEGKKYYLGDEAIEHYLSDNAQGRFVQSIKTLLPDTTFTSTAISGWGSYTIEDIVFCILSAMKHRFEPIIGQNIAAVVLGRPAVFSEDEDEDKIAEQRLLKAAKRAGFEHVRFQREPIAAALAYKHSLQKPELVFVGDFGGGTSDFTVMRLSPYHIGDVDDEILAVNGVSIAGDTFNSAIMRDQLLKHFGYHAHYRSLGDKWLDVPTSAHYELCEWHQIPFLKGSRWRELIGRMIHSSDDKQGFMRLQALVEENLGYSLFQSIQEAKCALSSDQISRVKFNRSIINIDEEITRKGFEEMIEGCIKKLGSCIDRTLATADINATDVDAAFLTGGTSQTPRIHQLMGDKFGEEKLRSGDTFTSVAEGLALSAPYLFK